ncbi:MAG: hypothetical protein ACAI43_26950, partial [Phycisphaerae bacterium]
METNNRKNPAGGGGPPVVTRSGRRRKAPVDNGARPRADAAAVPQPVESNRDVSYRGPAEFQAGSRARLHDAVARLGQAALSTADAQAFLDEVVARVAGALGAAYVQVQELSADGRSLDRRAAVGWR